MKAIKAAKLRVPEGTPEEHAELAEEAKERIVAVMRGRVHHTQAAQVLKASTRLRDEICGPLTNKTEVSGADGGPVIVEIRKFTEGE